ncbi:metal-dependent hydrolase [Sulfobacillus sp. hq2]|uniref:metal-dependent hydrolase n=1 Tax=Sulfobacillus sp. hq2 TaxID=2039167 RepID=UPI00130493FE|nr:metal-dependent hydrolase [Sulfobacillus sp. hq2]
MNARTHLLGGLVVASGVAATGMLGHPWALALASSLGSLLPDWDHPQSTLGRWLPWPSVSRSRGPHVPPMVGRAGWPHPIWHRHQAHSLVGITLAVAVVWIGLVGLWSALPPGLGHGLVPWGVVAAGLWLGSLSHLILDGFNETPQWWLWPFSQRGFRWPWHGSVRTWDGPMALGLVGLLLVLWLWR